MSGRGLGAFALLALAGMVPGVETPPLPGRRRVATIDSGPPRPAFPRSDPTPEQLEEYQRRAAAWREEMDRLEQERRDLAAAEVEAKVLATPKGAAAAAKRARRAERNRKLSR